MKKKGFTLIELLAVIAILAILLTIAVPSVIKISNNIKKSMYEKKIETLKSAVKLYALDNEEECSSGFDSENGCSYTIAMTELLDSGYVKEDIKDETGSHITNPYPSEEAGFLNDEYLDNIKFSITIKENEAGSVYASDVSCIIGRLLKSITSTATGFENINVKNNDGIHFTRYTSDGGISITATSVDPKALVEVCIASNCSKGTGQATSGDAFNGRSELSGNIRITLNGQMDSSYITIKHEDIIDDDVYLSSIEPTTDGLEKINFSPSVTTYNQKITNSSLAGGGIKATAKKENAQIKICIHGSDTRCSSGKGFASYGGEVQNNSLTFKITVSNNGKTKEYNVNYRK